MASRKLPLFTQHPRSWRENRYVYAVVSRRSKGLSIGVNLNPDTSCNFDCIYCCVDRTIPPKYRKLDMDILASELDQMLHLTTSGQIFAEPPLDQTPPELRRINDLAFSGNGEPTACRHFGRACRMAVELLGKYGLGESAKIIVITNATLFHRPEVAEAMAFLDQHHGEIWAKLDAGTEEYYRLIERTRVPMARVLENILAAGRLRPIVIQSLFMNVRGEGPTDAEIEAYIGRLRELAKRGCQIKLVQVYTTARRTAETYVTPLADAALDAIAAKVRPLGLNVETFYGPS